MGAKHSHSKHGGNGREAAIAYAKFVMQPPFQVVQTLYGMGPIAPEDFLTAFAVGESEITGYGMAADGKPLSSLTQGQMSAVRFIQLLSDPQSDAPRKEVAHLARRECLKVLAALNSAIDCSSNGLMAAVMATVAREQIEPLATDDPVATLMQCAATESNYQQLTRGLNSELSKDPFVKSPPSIPELSAALGTDPADAMIGVKPPHMKDREFKVAEWFYHLTEYWDKMGDLQRLAAEYVRLVLNLVPAARDHQGDIYSMLRSRVEL